MADSSDSAHYDATVLEQDNTQRPHDSVVIVVVCQLREEQSDPEGDTLLEITSHPTLCTKWFLTHDIKYSSKIYNMNLGLIFDSLLLIPSLMFVEIGNFFWVILFFILFESFLYPILFLVTGICVVSLKKLINKPRPKNGGTMYKLKYNCTKIDKIFRKKSNTFPSGDAAQASVFAVYLSYYHGYTYWWFAFIPWVSLARVYLGKHYISDVIAGAVIGLVNSFIVCYFVTNQVDIKLYSI